MARSTGLARAAVLIVTLGVAASAACSGSKDTTEIEPGSPGPDASMDSTVQVDGGRCTTPRVLCGETCSDTRFDRSNCGECGKECPQGKVCSNWLCELQCSGGTTRCGESCFDTKVAPAHCGGCDTSCATGQVCAAGKCVVACPAGQVECNGGCVDPSTSRAYCGATAGCGVKGGAPGSACGAGHVCGNGTCALSCPPGLIECDATCIDPKSDRAHCGAGPTCSADAGTAGVACPQGEVCALGACALSCPVGLIECNGTCVDPNTDRAQCGATAGCGVEAGISGTVCASGHVCSVGACALSCPPGMVVCAGKCIDPLSSRTHCGASLGCGLDGGVPGTTCGPGQVCASGGCATSCPPGQVECGGTCIDPFTSRAHCGASAGCGADAGTAGTVCPSGEVCAAGTCTLSCPSGLVACGGTCLDPRTDRSHCGATIGCGATGGIAGSACLSGEVCADGKCALSCQVGSVECAGTCIDPKTSRTRCGATLGCGVDAGSAGTVCAPQSSCVGGVCKLTCAPNQAACGGQCVDTFSDPSHCGAWGNCQGVAAGSACGPGFACVNARCASLADAGSPVCAAATRPCLASPYYQPPFPEVPLDIAVPTYVSVWTGQAWGPVPPETSVALRAACPDGPDLFCVSDQMLKVKLLSPGRYYLVANQNPNWQYKLDPTPELPANDATCVAPINVNDSTGPVSISYGGRYLAPATWVTKIVLVSPRAVDLFASVGWGIGDVSGTLSSACDGGTTYASARCELATTCFGGGNNPGNVATLQPGTYYLRVSLDAGVEGTVSLKLQ